MEKSGKTSSNKEMFIGTYYHVLEEKGRISVPKEFREGLGSQSIITRGLDGCLTIFTLSSWEKLTEKLSELPLSNKQARNFLRSLTFNAATVEFDKLGRTRLPEHLIQLAGLSKQVVFAGALRRVEVWDRDKFHEYSSQLDDIDDDIEEALKELGI